MADERRNGVIKAEDGRAARRGIVPKPGDGGGKIEDERVASSRDIQKGRLAAVENREVAPCRGAVGEYD